MDDGYICECGSTNCEERLFMPLAEYGEWAVEGKEIYMISNACKCGPEPHEVLLEKRQTYSLYEWVD